MEQTPRVVSFFFPFLVQPPEQHRVPEKQPEPVNVDQFRILSSSKDSLERTERIERTERTERIERTERTERIERTERTERIERTERTERLTISRATNCRFEQFIFRRHSFVQSSWIATIRVVLRCPEEAPTEHWTRSISTDTITSFAS